jgi:hypothetical protein
VKTRSKCVASERNVASTPLPRGRGGALHASAASPPSVLKASGTPRHATDHAETISPIPSQNHGESESVSSKPKAIRRRQRGGAEDREERDDLEHQQGTLADPVVASTLKAAPSRAGRSSRSSMSGSTNAPVATIVSAPPVPFPSQAQVSAQASVAQGPVPVPGPLPAREPSTRKRKVIEMDGFLSDGSVEGVGSSSPTRRTGGSSSRSKSVTEEPKDVVKDEKMLSAKEEMAAADDDGDDSNYIANMSSTRSPVASSKKRRTSVTYASAALKSIHDINLDDDEGGALAATKASLGARYLSSLTVLTKKFVEILQNAPEKTVDLKVAADMLEVQKRRIYDITNVLEGIGMIEKQPKGNIRWRGIPSADDEGEEESTSAIKAEVAALVKEELFLEEQITLMNKLNFQLSTVSEDGSSSITSEGKPHAAYVTYDDIRELEGLQEQITLAIKACKDTFLEVPDPDEGLAEGVRRYEILLHSSSSPIDVFLINKAPITGCHEGAQVVSLPTPSYCVDSGRLKSPSNFSSSSPSPLRPNDYTALNELFTDGM